MDPLASNLFWQVWIISVAVFTGAPSRKEMERQSVPKCLNAIHQQRNGVGGSEQALCRKCMASPCISCLLCFTTPYLRNTIVITMATCVPLAPVDSQVDSSEP